jgi:hypothetical protein
VLGRTGVGCGIAQIGAYLVERLRQCLLLNAIPSVNDLITHLTRKTLAHLQKRRADLIFSGGNEFGCC